MAEKIALVLVNTGSPAAPTPGAVATYLSEFLSDRRIVPLSPILWQPLLQCLVIPRRKAKAAARYKAIWRKEGSPLVTIQSDLAQKLQASLGENWRVVSAMRYGTPSLGEELLNLKVEGIKKVVLMPLYAQKASQTVGSVLDGLSRALHKDTYFQAVRVVKPWYRDPAYIQAIALRIARVKEANPETYVVMSFHSIPVKGSEEYVRHVKDTLALVRSELQLRDFEITASYQSKFGKGEWLTPMTKSVVENLPALGKKNVTILCPGFSVDCLESLEEVAIGLKNTFLEAGGETFNYIPCLNADEDAIALYKALALKTAENL